MTVLDPQTLALPDWHGNNRIDELAQHRPRWPRQPDVPDPRRQQRAPRQRHRQPDRRRRPSAPASRSDGKQPRTVIVIRIAEVYSQCARALIRVGALDLRRPVAGPAHAWATCCARSPKAGSTARPMTPIGRVGQRRRCGDLGMTRSLSASRARRRTPAGPPFAGPRSVPARGHRAGRRLDPPATVTSQHPDPRCRDKPELRRRI